VGTVVEYDGSHLGAVRNQGTHAATAFDVRLASDAVDFVARGGCIREEEGAIRDDMRLSAGVSDPVGPREWGVVYDERILAFNTGDIGFFLSLPLVPLLFMAVPVVNSTKTPDLIPIFYLFFRSLYAPVSNHVIPALALAELLL
jgi:hypothetical protein